TLEMHHLVRDQSGVEHFVEHDVMAMTPTAEYVAAAESAGLGVEVEDDYMPGRDRIIAVRRAYQNSANQPHLNAEGRSHITPRPVGGQHGHAEDRRSCETRPVRETQSCSDH